MNKEALELWKLKKIIKELDNAKGHGTSMISLIISPRESIPKLVKKLNDEEGTASNIKSRVNRLSVLGALTSAKNKLKLYREIPENGLVIYSGTYIIPTTGKEKKVTYDIIPPRRLKESGYMCDNIFHTECLHQLFESNDIWGYIVIDGDGCLFGTLCGKDSRVIYEFDVDLPKKHGRGGQSKQRFERLGEEARHNYIRKCCEYSVQFFITDNKPNVRGIFIGGHAMMKERIIKSDLLDQRLKKVVIETFDIQYGGTRGFDSIILLSSSSISENKLLDERKILIDLFEKISLQPQIITLGIKPTLNAYNQGLVKELLIYEELKYEDGNKIVDPDFFIENAICNITLISDKSPESSQFIHGFEGLCSILYYEVDNFEENDEGEIDEGENSNLNSDDEFI